MVEITKLDANGQDIVQVDTPHGVLRTMLRPAQNTDATNAALITRHDERFLLFTLVIGQHAAPLSDAISDILWQNMPTPDASASDFIEPLKAYLLNDAKQIADDYSQHAFTIGAFSRQVNTGRTWLAWLGTSGIHVLNRSGRVVTVTKGLVAGEGWSAKSGLSPDANAIHTEVLTTNAMSRLVAFTNVMRPMIDELPYLGRATIQRVADAQAMDVPAVFFDLRISPVTITPEEVNVYYRWESAIQATLFWSGGEDATGYRIEQASSATFEDPLLLAELTDSRQRTYSVQPSPEADTFYRIIPMNDNVLGMPSPPIIVTPVPLVAPVVESIAWQEAGGVTVTWTAIPQANYYELESSPDPDFDSPETAIVYRGEANSYQTPSNYPTGWFFRVRSLNTHFAPRTPSFWSLVRRAPVRLLSPQFLAIEPDMLYWNEVPAARSYEIRRFTGTSGNESQQEIIAVTGTTFEITDATPAIYQVRAILETGDEFSASEWSHPAVLGGWTGDVKETLRTEEKLRAGNTVEMPSPTRSQQQDIEKVLGSTDVPVPNAAEGAMPSSAWQLVIIAAAVALGLGLLVGLIGGPRLGIGLDATNTPVSQADRIATNAQATALWNDATQRAVLDLEVSQMSALGTEEAILATTEAERSTELEFTIDGLQSAASTSESVQAQLNDDIATQSAINAEEAAQRANAESALSDLQATATFSSEQITQLEDANTDLRASRDDLQATATSVFQIAATQGADATATISALSNAFANSAEMVMSLNNDIATNEAMIEAFEADLAEAEQQITEISSTATALSVSATVQSDLYSTQEAELVNTITALAPTETPTPSMTPPPTYTPTPTLTPTPMPSATQTLSFFGRE